MGDTGGHNITTADVSHVAKLARLALSEEKLQKLTQQLESILKYVAKIGQADTSGVEDSATIVNAAGLSNVLREDVAEPGLTLEQVLQNAPQTDGPFFRVPKVIGGDEESAG